MRVVIYARVSTEEQATDGVSLSTQTAKLTAYCGLYDLTIVETIIDAGESAKSLRRPGLQRALAMLKAGQADALVVSKLDRLTRSVADWQTLVDDYFGERAGKQLMSVADSIDTRTAAGRLVLNVLLSVAQWEREAIGERTREVLQHKIRKGERCGAIRYGFDLAADGRTLVPNAAEQATVQQMMEWQAQGKTLRQIASALNESGAPSKSGRRWSHKTVGYVLKTPRIAA